VQCNTIYVVSTITTTKKLLTQVLNLNFGHSVLLLHLSETDCHQNRRFKWRAVSSQCYITMHSTHAVYNILILEESLHKINNLSY
jgi:hypothetical protein